MNMMILLIYQIIVLKSTHQCLFMLDLHNLLLLQHLLGYEDAVRETGRETQDRQEISDELMSLIDAKLQLIRENLNKKYEVSFTYFISDLYKDGGKYITEEGIVKKFDDINQQIILMDKRIIPINDLINISFKNNVLNSNF